MLVMQQYTVATDDAKVKDLSLRLQILQTQYDHAMSKLSGQKDSAKRNDEDIEVTEM